MVDSFNSVELVKACREKKTINKIQINWIASYVISFLLKN
jgi:hypothetical protein